MDAIIRSLEAAYQDSWHDIMAGAILIDAAYFVGGAIFFFLLYERKRRSLKLSQLPRYVFDPRTAYETAPEDHVRRSSWIDRQAWLLHFLWFPPMTAITTSLALAFGVYLQAVFIGWFGARAPFQAASWLIVMFQVSAIFLVGDLGNYWNHRWMHRFPIYWSFHRVHHSAETLTYFTNGREHPLEVLPSVIIQGLFNGLGAGLALWFSGTRLLPATLPILVGLGIVWNVRGILFHSHIPLSFGKLDYVIGGPLMHQLHHSAEARHFSRNFGVQLFCWDWIFGTIYRPKPGERFRLGLSETELGRQNPHGTIKDYYWEPVVHAFRTVFPAKPQVPAAEVRRREDGAAG